MIVSYFLYGMKSKGYLNPVFEITHRKEEAMQFDSKEDCVKFIEENLFLLKDKLPDKEWSIKEIYKIT